MKRNAGEWANETLAFRHYEQLWSSKDKWLELEARNRNTQTRFNEFESWKKHDLKKWKDTWIRFE